MNVITVQGEGGAVWDMDAPAEGSLAEERFESQVASGMLTVLNETEPRPVKSDEPFEPVVDEFDLATADKDELIAYAEAHDIEVDGRLGVEKLRESLATEG